MLKLEYLKILIFFIVAFLFVFLIISLSLLLNKNIFRLSKRKPVECGSHSFGSGKNKIEINFYIITILFIIFEIEFIILIP
jgi:NADH-quinone oxidoreductase subunit A